jgi:hypothetical protein
MLKDPDGTIMDKYRENELHREARPAFEITEAVEENAAQPAADTTQAMPPDELMERLLEGLQDFDEE